VGEAKEEEKAVDDLTGHFTGLMSTEETDSDDDYVKHFFTLVESFLTKPTTLTSTANTLVDNLNSLALIY
jgi:hypothetical protein